MQSLASDSAGELGAGDLGTRLAEDTALRPRAALAALARDVALRRAREDTSRSSISN